MRNKYEKRRLRFHFWLDEACKRFNYKTLGQKIKVHPQTLSKWHRGIQHIADFRLKGIIAKLRKQVRKFDQGGVQ